MTPDKKKPLQKGIERLAALREDLTRLPEVESDLVKQAEILRNGLTEGEIHALLVPDSRAAQTEKSHALSAIRTRLEHLPGARTQLQRLVGEQESKLVLDIRNLLGEYRNKAKTRLEELQSQQMQSMLAVCGGDAERTKKAVEQVVANSEANRWLNLFTVGSGIADPCLHVPWLFKACDRFDAVETADF